MSTIISNDQKNINNLSGKIEPIQTALEELAKASATPENPEHVAYLQKKGISKEDIPGLKFGYYFNSPSLLIPLKDLNGDVKSIQYIHYDKEGGKRVNFLKGAEKSGCFLSFDPLEDGGKIFITEGIATASSLKKILRSSKDFEGSKVVCAFSSGEIVKVAKLLKERFEYAEIIAAPDADNAGSEASKKCRAIGVYSIFPPHWDKGTDWNDLHLKLGVDGAFKEVEKSISIKNISALPEPSPERIPEIEEILEHLDEDPCKDLSMEHFPPVLRQYIESICDTTEAHPIMIIMSVLCSVSAFVGTKVYIPKGAYFQDLYPNIWSLCINKSGGFKSTALNKGSSIPIQVDREILNTIKELKEKENPNFDPLEGNDKFSDEVKAMIRKEELKRPMLPSRQTAEFLIKHLSQGHQGMILASEMGEWLKNMEKSHNGDLKQLFTSFYDVDIPPYSHCTKTSGSYIVQKPFMTINAVSTIDWIQKDVKVEDVFSGFFARFLLFSPPFQDVVPDALPKKGKSVDFEVERKIKETLLNLDLEKKMYLPESVRCHFEVIHQSLYQMVKCSKYDERCQKFLEPYLKRWSPYILKLAILFRIMEDPFSNEISETSLKASTEIIRIAVKSTAKLFEKELGESQDQQKQRKVFEWIATRLRKNKASTFSQLVSSKVLEGGSKEYEEIVQTLIDSKKILCSNSSENKSNWLLEVTNV